MALRWLIIGTKLIGTRPCKSDTILLYLPAILKAVRSFFKGENDRRVIKTTLFYMCKNPQICLLIVSKPLDTGNSF